MDFRTDLALERNEVYKKQNNLQQIEGVDIENDVKDEVEISRIKITNEEGEKALNKPIGNYITLDVKQIKLADEERLEVIAEIVADELRNTISKHVKNTDDIMVVGLGNLYVTPDALGPKVVPKIEVTRHILEYMPKVMPEDTRPVSAISPGVLGITGIETMEILKGVVDNVKPKLLIVIDALASRSIDRISSSIQIADTGIVPGAGVENKRKEISQNTLGIPVIAIGIPTVVDLATVTNECIDIFIESLQEKAMSNDYLNKLKEKDNYEEIKETLSKIDDNVKTSIQYGQGIRILNQDLWEMIISYIISANNNIPRIKGIIERLSKTYGKEIEWNGEKYYAFPTVEELKDVTVEDYRKLGTGFRDIRLYETVHMILDKKVDLEQMQNNPNTMEVREQLLTLSGVGPKVADCILLFSTLKRFEVFPIDVWVRRVMNELYIKNEDETKVNKKELEKLAHEKFGNLAGIAQQYLFYWKREA